MKHYREYGIDPSLVERLRKKAKKNPGRVHVKRLTEGVTKEALQNQSEVRRLIGLVSRSLKEPIPPDQLELMTRFVVDQQIDPDNMLQLMKLYTMVRKM